MGSRWSPIEHVPVHLVIDAAIDRCRHRSGSPSVGVAIAAHLDLVPGEQIVLEGPPL